MLKQLRSEGRRQGAMGYPDGKRVFFDARVGERMKEKRKECGLTMVEAEREVGVSKSSIEKAENGQGCSIYLLARMAHAYDCTLDELVPIDALDM